MPSPVFRYPDGFSADITAGPNIPGTADEYELNFARRALAKIKDRLGPEAIENILRSDIKDGECYWTEMISKNTPGEFNRSSVQLSVKGITVDEFLKWFHTRCSKNVAYMQSAEPEHWVVTSDDTGTQRVIENLGSTIACFNIEFGPPTEPCQKLGILEDFPTRMSATAKLSSGHAFAHVLHQFKPHHEGSGFDANLGAYFLKSAGSDVVEQHRQHLVVEFTNWTRHCFRELKVEGIRI